MFAFTPESFKVHKASRSAIKVFGNPEVDRVDKQRARQERRIRKAFHQFVEDATSDDVLDQVGEMYRRGDLLGIMRLPLPHIKELSGIIRKTFIATANEETKYLIGVFDINVVKVNVSASIDLTFNSGDALAADWVRQAERNFIREISKAQREVIRRAMTEALEQGVGYVEASRMFKMYLPLTTFQQNAVKNFRRLLEQNNREALTRVLRDRRFDSSISRAIRSGSPLSSSHIDNMVGRYQSRMVDMRAETIARTEGQAATNAARHESTRQIMQKAGIKQNEVERIWHTTIDTRERRTHRLMNGQKRGINAKFKSPSGAKLKYPGDRSAPAAEVINCRCVLETRFKEEAEATQVQQKPVAVQPGVTAIEQAQAVDLAGSLYTSHPEGLYYVPKDRLAASALTRGTGRPIDSFKVVSQTEKELNDFMDDAYNKSLKRALTEAEELAMTDYTGPHYMSINKVGKALRVGEKPSNVSNVPAMDSAFKKVSLSEDVVVYRGLKERRFGELVKNLKAGQTIIFDKGYMSATISRKITNVFGSRAVEILLPRGTKAFPVAPISNHRLEFEILMNRGSEFIVRKVSKDRIVLELLPPNPAVEIL